MRRLILLGAPGAGKGSQAAKISEYYHIPHISTGDVFRENIASGTDIGKYAKTFIDKGLLVPDDVTVQIVAEKLAACKNGFLLDGFPRSIPQAEALSKLTTIDAVIDIQVDFSLIVKRLSGRRVCDSCGSIYHTSTYTKGECEKCGGNLYIRDDDNEESIVKRLEVYNKTTAPVTEYYQKLGLLHKVGGNDKIEDTFREVKAVLGE